MKMQLIREQFGDLEVIEYHKTDKWGSAIWKCQCKCGRISYVRGSSLKSGVITKCRFCATKKHGLYKSKIYSVWQGMKTRCTNPNAINYHNYGDRGILYDSAWEIFTNFYKDRGDNYKEGLTLERKNNNLGYSKDNCKWVTPKQQNLNMRTNALLFYNGKVQTITEWGQELRIRRRILYSLRAYHKNWTDKQIIEEAVKRI